jgi:hypothetical protein
MIHNHQTAPTQFVEAKGIRFAYRRFGNAAHASAASHPAHWAVATRWFCPIRLATNDLGARGTSLAARSALPSSLRSGRFQFRRSRALLDVRVVKSSILERNVLRIGDVFAL